MGGPPTSLEDSRVGKELPGNENFVLRQLLKQAAAVGTFMARVIGLGAVGLASLELPQGLRNTVTSSAF